MSEKNNLEVVSIRLKKERPLMSHEPINQPIVAVNAVGKYLSRMDREVVCVINCNSDLKPINCSFVSIGALDNSIVSPREIFKSSILSNAKSIILVHNHPSNNLAPSKADISVTDRMVQSCELLDISFLDHIIVGTEPGIFYSFREKGILEDKNSHRRSNAVAVNFSIDEAAKKYLAQNNVRLKRKSR